MKRLVILIMVLLLFTGSGLKAMAALAPQPTVEPGKGTHSGGIKDENVGTDINLQSNDGNDAMHYVDSMAVQFYATTSFNSIIKTLYSDSGTFTVTIYKWLGSYEATIGSGKQIAAQERFDNITSGGKRIVMSFDTLPDGEYVIHVSDPNENGIIGGTAKTEASDFKTNSYKDDEYWEATAISFLVHYTNTPNNLLGPVQDPYGLEVPTEENPETNSVNYVPMIILIFLAFSLILFKMNVYIKKHF